MSVWFITGASRGFGAEMVKEALARGNQVVATARHLEDNAGRGLLGAVEEASDAADRAEVADPPLRIQLGADVRHA